MEHTHEHHQHHVHPPLGAGPPPTVAKGEQKSVEAKPGDIIYTCPMHPQIRQIGPGNCPICGMALEPVMPTAVNTVNPELVDMSRRFWVALVLAVPLLLTAMGELVGIAAAAGCARQRCSGTKVAAPFIWSHYCWGRDGGRWLTGSFGRRVRPGSQRNPGSGAPASVPQVFDRVAHEDGRGKPAHAAMVG